MLHVPFGSNVTKTPKCTFICFIVRRNDRIPPWLPFGFHRERAHYMDIPLVGYWPLLLLLEINRNRSTTVMQYRKKNFLKFEKRCRRDQTGKSKDLISSAYCRCKIWKRVEPEFLTNFLNSFLATEVTNSEFRRNSRLKEAIWYMDGFTQRDYTLVKNNHFNYTSGEKKLGWVN